MSESMLERVERAIIDAMNCDPRGGSFSRAAHAALEAIQQEAEPAAWMHPHGAIWRADNYPSDLDFSKDGWIPLYAFPVTGSDDAALSETRKP